MEMDMREINASEQNFSEIMNETSFLNGTYNDSSLIDDWGGSMYPSGYRTIEIASIALFISFAMVVVVVGNMLVIIAIVTEKALKHITNWFIASLAVADLLLGLVIMPFSLANLLMGYWVFGEVWCELHSAIDVLLSTASINNICLISLDRYWSITHAIEYLKNRTAGRAAFMIVAVWVISGLISIPPLLGWKVDRPHAEFPKCTVSDELGYVLYSACGSFYVPSCIMIFVYIRIYYAAKARANRNVTKAKKKPKPTPGCWERFRARNHKTLKSKSTPKSTSNLAIANTTESHCEETIAKSTNTTSFTAVPTSLTSSTEDTKIKDTTRPNAHKKVLICDVKVHKEEPNLERLSPCSSEIETPVTPLRTVSERVDADRRNHNVKGENGVYVRSCNQSVQNTDIATSLHPTTAPSESGETSLMTVAQPCTLRRGPSAPSMDGDHMSDMDPSSSDSGALTRCSVMKPLKLRFCQPLLGKKLTKPKRELIDMGRVTSPSVLDPEKEKKRIARKKEKRATLILGLIMGSFIACWLPFFFMYILVPLCPACYIPGYAFDLAFWLGYMNSAFNPVIYTIFNQDFRKAFRKILFK